MNILKNKWLQYFFIPFSLVYSVILRFRNKLYDWRIFRTTSIDGCKIISVGNITVGGTGKTPAVEYLAQFMLNKGDKIVILSRGYRRKSKGTVIVSDGKQICANYKQSGDEPYLLARNLKNVPVVVENNRVKGCNYIMERFHPDFIILDDAYQHRRIHRDIDMVLIDSTIGFGNLYTLPAGILREPLVGLERASLICLTRVEQSNSVDHLINLIRGYTSVPIIKANHDPLYLQNVFTNQKTNLRELSSRKVFVFSGIGNPESFARTLTDLNAIIIGKAFFRDHYFYDKNKISAIIDQANELNAEWIITTEKDAIKLDHLIEESILLFFLKITFKITDLNDQLTYIAKV